MEKIKRISLIAIIFIGFAFGFLTLKNLLGIVPQHQIKASNFQLFNRVSSSLFLKTSWKHPC